ncbi:hypothetical protein X777_12866 [Ooceraea biroi]|uniref:Uncharacterized protein n=1 Tax=Ooceraea biroi TaxID=2015173 RepID=A0A026VY35_OOCBI|nr:hypothetical protein X777_12866 [Ooceraea biroi]
MYRGSLAKWTVRKRLTIAGAVQSNWESSTELNSRSMKFSNKRPAGGARAKTVTFLAHCREKMQELYFRRYRKVTPGI